MAQQVLKYSELDWKTQLLTNDLLTKSNRNEIQTYKVEEGTYGTLCKFCLPSRLWLTEKYAFVVHSSGIKLTKK